MVLTSSLLTLASQNLSSSLQHVSRYSYCSRYYASFDRSRDCSKAIGLLEKGANEVSFAVHSGTGPHDLPLSKSHGRCVIQVDVAGPRLPQTFNIVPDDIRHMANVVLDDCVYGSLYIGGFTTSDLQAMNNWITADGTRLDGPFPTSTAFLTVTLSNPVPDWLSPGNYDPGMARTFSQVELAAMERAHTFDERLDLRQRATRLRRQADKMEPRGSRVPWWEDPGVSGEVNETSVDTGDRTVSIELPKPLASDAGTATSKRRRRT